MHITGKTPHVIVEIDRRHPMASRIARLGRKLYAVYIKPLEGQAPERRNRFKYHAPTTPKYDASLLNLYILGEEPRMRMLHLLAEVSKIPAFMLVRLLGNSSAMYKQIRSLEHVGIVKTWPRGVDLFVELNPEWPAYKELRGLLRALNTFFPEYKALANVHRKRQRQKLYDWSVRLRRTHAYKRQMFAKRTANK